MIKISPSILNADFLNLKECLDSLKNADVDMIHLDVMDGDFVPNITFGPDIIRSIRKNTPLTLDTHLMISKPHRYIKEFAECSDILGFHYEAESDVMGTIDCIKDFNRRCCLAIKPKTDVEEVLKYLPYIDMVLVMSVEPGFGGQKFMDSSLQKIKALREYEFHKGLKYDIEVDGGINKETSKMVIEAGANVLVMGSYLMSGDIKQKVNEIKNMK